MNYRLLHSSFWTDEFVEQLTPEEKFFFIYLLTNQHVTAAGIYRLPLKHAAVDTGYNEETVRRLLQRFTDAGKVRTSSISNEIAIRNWTRYNRNASPKSRACVVKQLQTVKDQSLVSFVYDGVEHYEEFWAAPVENASEAATTGHSEPLPQSSDMRHRCPIDIQEQEQDQEQETEQEQELLSSADADSIPATGLTVDSVVAIYHEQLPELAQVLKINPRRRAMFRQRLHEDKSRNQLHWWREYFAAVAKSDWLTGNNSSGFRADFEWLLNGNNMLKVLEGRYADRTGCLPFRPENLSGATRLKLLAMQMREREEGKDERA